MAEDCNVKEGDDVQGGLRKLMLLYALEVIDKIIAPSEDLQLHWTAYKFFAYMALYRRYRRYRHDNLTELIADVQYRTEGMQTEDDICHSQSDFRSHFLPNVGK